MHKVLIADIEEENIRKLKSHIRYNFRDSFKVVKTVTNNQEDIIEILKKVETDLLIADVRFFGAKVSKVITDIQDRFQNLKFILYGSMNDVEYLAYSANVGSLGYMLKPLRATEMTTFLNTAKTHFDKMVIEQKRFAELQESYRKNITLFENYFLTNLLKGIIKDEDEIINNFDYFNISITAPYTVISIRANDFKKKMLVMDEEEKHLFIYQLLNTVKLSIEDHENVCMMNSFNAITVIIGSVEDSEKIMKICENIKESIYQSNNSRVSIGIGRTYKELSNISVSFNESEGALKHKFYMGYSTIIPIEYVEPNNMITYMYPSYKENKLVHTAVAGEIRYCKRLLKEIFDSLRSAEPLPEKLLSQIIVNILISIGRHLSEQNILKDIDFSEFFPIGKAMQIKDVEEGFDYLNNALENFCKYVVKERKNSNILIFRNAKNHINDKYYETISPTVMAKRINTTPEHLNNLFLEYEKMAYYDYVVGVRIAVAKKLLGETDLTDAAIAIKVGYVDERYFKSIFRQHERITTDEYRVNLKLKKD